MQLMPGSHRTAIVTGVSKSRGIGRAIVVHLLREKYRVVGLDLVQPAWQEDAEASENFKFVQCDLTEEDRIDAAASEAASWLNKSVNVLVNNAGIAQPYMPTDRKERKRLWHKYIATNLSAAFLLSEAILPYMPETESSIVHISSTRAQQSEGNSEGYGSSKAGLIGLTHSQAVTLGPACRVNAILPGYIHTQDEEPEAVLGREDHEWHLTGRVGCPEDVAELCAFLADPQRSKFITGQQFVIDGGVSKKMVYPE